MSTWTNFAKESWHSFKHIYFHEGDDSSINTIVLLSPYLNCWNDIINIPIEIFHNFWT